MRVRWTEIRREKFAARDIFDFFGGGIAQLVASFAKIFCGFMTCKPSMDGCRQVCSLKETDQPDFAQSRGHSWTEVDQNSSTKGGQNGWP